MIPYLLEQGHQVLNVDLIPLYYADVDNLTVGTYNVIEAAVPCHNFASKSANGGRPSCAVTASMSTGDAITKQSVRAIRR